MPGEICIPITQDGDLVIARARGRALAQRLGFTRPDPTLIATAISELARNVVMHVGHGEIIMRPLYEDRDRKSTRLNSSHANISYAVFCLKKKKKKIYDYSATHY